MSKVSSLHGPRRHVETASKQRSLAAGSVLHLSGRKVIEAWPNLEHVVGTTLQSAIDSEGPVILRSRLQLERPTYVWSQSPPMHGSVFSPSGYRALAPWAHYATLMAICRAKRSLTQAIIIVNVILLVIMGLSSSCLCLTLKQGIPPPPAAVRAAMESPSQLELQNQASWQGDEHEDHRSRPG